MGLGHGGNLCTQRTQKAVDLPHWYGGTNTEPGYSAVQGGLSHV